MIKGLYTNESSGVGCKGRHRAGSALARLVDLPEYLHRTCAACRTNLDTFISLSLFILHTASSYVLDRPATTRALFPCNLLPFSLSRSFSLEYISSTPRHPTFLSCYRDRYFRVDGKEERLIVFDVYIRYEKLRSSEVGRSKVSSRHLARENVLDTVALISAVAL